MLGDNQAYAILVASDLERAKKFYEEKLGLKMIPGPSGIAMFQAGSGSMVVLYEKEGGPKATNTVLGFDVKNLEQLLTDLKAKGVKQDMRDLPEGANEQGIMSYGPVKSAWINDSEGNIIALNEMID